MSYIDANLSAGEQVVFRTGPTWLFWLTGFFFLLTALWTFGIGLLVFLWIVVKQLTTEIAITNRRFIYKKGWLFQRVTEIQLTKVESTILAQGPIGRLFGYGTLTVRGTGVGIVTLPSIDDPRRLKQAIEAVIPAYQQR